MEEPFLNHNPAENQRSKNTSDIRLACIITTIVVGTIIMILSIVAYSKSGSYNAVVMDFKTNWDLRPIVDIVTSPSECPPTHENLIQREWPGTNVGCDCTWSWNYAGLITGSCDSNHTAAGCVTVRPTNPMPLHKFYSYKI